MLLVILFIIFVGFQTEAFGAEAELSWDTQTYINKQANAYIEHCAETTMAEIDTRHGFGLILGVKATNKRKRYSEKTLAWVAHERDEAAKFIDTLKLDLENYREKIELYEDSSDHNDNETDFVAWLSTTTHSTVEEAKEWEMGLQIKIVTQQKLLHALTNFYDKRITAATSKEGAIAFVLQNVEGPHADFFAAHRTAVEKYITDTYYPDAEEDATSAV